MLSWRKMLLIAYDWSCIGSICLVDVRYMTQETLRNPRIHHMGNPQFFHSIVEDIHGFVKGYPRNSQRIPVELCKMIPWNRVK